MIEVSNLRTGYGERVVFDGLDLTIAGGRITGVLGPNGAGKTTLMKAITGRIAITGDIRIDGFSHTEFAASNRRDLFFLPDEGFVYGYLTPVEFARFVLSMYEAGDAETEARARVLLRAFDLEPDRLVRELSHGMKRKTFLTPFLAMTPRVLLLDEAVNGVDAAGIAVLKRVLRRLADAGSTIVLTSHVADLVESVADEVLIVNDGAIAHHGAVADLAAPLEDVYLDTLGIDVDADVARFLGDSPSTGA